MKPDASTSAYGPNAASTVTMDHAAVRRAMPTLPRITLASSACSGRCGRRSARLSGDPAGDIESLRCISDNSSPVLVSMAPALAKAHLASFMSAALDEGVTRAPSLNTLVGQP